MNDTFEFFKPFIPSVSQITSFLDELSQILIKEGTINLVIQNFGDRYAITLSTKFEKQRDEAIFPADVIYIDSNNVKKALIKEFRELYKNNYDNNTLYELGYTLFNYFIPPVIRDTIKKYEDQTKRIIIFTTTEHDLPWEFMHNGKEFWCTKYSVARRVGFFRNVPEFDKSKSKQQEQLLKVLIIADPTNNTSSAQEHGDELNNILKEKKNIKPTLIKGPGASKISIIKELILTKYDIIHYIGHSDYNDVDPSKSALHLSDGKLNYDEIIRLKMENRPVVFLNSCSSADNEVKNSEYEFVGDKTVSLASAFLIAGAIAVIGTMYPIKPKKAAFFAATFYEHLKREEIGEALRKTRNTARNEKYDIKDWVPYTLYGDAEIRFKQFA